MSCGSTTNAPVRRSATSRGPTTAPSFDCWLTKRRPSGERARSCDHHPGHEARSDCRWRSITSNLMLPSGHASPNAAKLPRTFRLPPMVKSRHDTTPPRSPLAPTSRTAAVAVTGSVTRIDRPSVDTEILPLPMAGHVSSTSPVVGSQRRRVPSRESSKTAVPVGSNTAEGPFPPVPAHWAIGLAGPSAMR